MIIIGAGLSGLIAANMLRNEVTEIWEAQKSLPNNHSALLRFRSSVVGDAVGIPFKKVRVMKSIVPYRNPVADAISYSLKCTGKAELRSIISANGEINERYISPPDLISRLADQSFEKIRFGTKIEKSYGDDETGFISTIPMPALMDILGWENKPFFGKMRGTVINATLPENIDVYATLYFPDPEVLPYRASITGRELIIEMSHNGSGEIRPGLPVWHKVIKETLNDFGLCGSYYQSIAISSATIKEMEYAKITPIDENIRKRFILWASEHHNIYSLGRFATWRPGLLLDDIVNDVRVIQRLASGDAAHLYKAAKR